MARIKKRKTKSNVTRIKSDASYANPVSVVEQQKASLKDFKYAQQALIRKSISGPRAGGIVTAGRPAAFNKRPRNVATSPAIKSTTAGIKKRRKK